LEKAERSISREVKKKKRKNSKSKVENKVNKGKIRRDERRNNVIQEKIRKKRDG
jgi:hypothetical protein